MSSMYYKSFVIFNLAALSSCTISLQNISTNGKAEDVVDDQLEASADVKPDVNVSAVP